MTGLLAGIQPEPDRDRWGRYKLPALSAVGDDGSRDVRSWTRVTTFAKSISDSMGLTKWQIRMAVRGIAMRPDLLALAASAPADDRSTLDRVAEQAKEAAGTSSGANSGTALHAMTERVDRGERLNVPPPWDADVAAYSRALRAARVTVDPELIERIVVCEALGVAGTFDRVLRLPGGTLVIGDLKTGRDLSYSWLEIAIQLAIYANADAMWNGITGQYEPMPAVDKDMGLVVHLPVGSAKATLYGVDLRAGWAAAQLCASVREQRALKNLAWVYGEEYAELSDEDIDAIEAAGVAEQIAVAQSRAELEQLWTIHERVWTTALTAAANARLAQLAAA